MIRPTRVLFQQIKNAKGGVSDIGTPHVAKAIVGDAITDKLQLRRLMQEKTWSIKQLLKNRAIKLHHHHHHHHHHYHSDVDDIDDGTGDGDGGEFRGNGKENGAPETSKISEINDDLILKIVALSGFSNPGVHSPRFDQLRHAFKLQKTFLDHLYDDVDSVNGDGGIESDLHRDEEKEDAAVVSEAVSSETSAAASDAASSGNDIQFRLVAGDHLPGVPITLEALLRSIDELDGQVDAEKGELGFDLRTLRKDR
ncbi:GTF1 [Candida theae]|uniref:GTF1 n=1 Tax=Candida theae TaxID=1198502 RepID=A0AAD5BJM9_9ASCO|nr:GTF1 [Candida theae]KAI5968819.1 GTF1 [Candida theae]